MKYLIVGVSGFIGSHADSFFRKQGAEVFGCSPHGTQHESLYIVNKFDPDFKRIFREHQFDVCLNAAGSSGVGYSMHEPEKDYLLNVELVNRLLESIAAYSPQTKFINLSSAAVYGNPTLLPVREDSIVHPISPYGEHKLEAEQLCNAYTQQKGIATASLRIFSVYGPGLHKQLFWDIYNKTLCQQPGIELFGTGYETRDFIFIDDLLQAIDLVIKKSHFNHHRINLANGEETSIDEAAHTLLDALGIQKEIVFNQQVRLGDPLNWQADISELKAFGYQKRFSIAEGLNEYAKWLGKI